MKSGDEIEADAFKLVKGSGIASFINGTVYRDGMRPLNSMKEDAIVIFKTGLEGQFQTGEIVLNIYVSDIKGPDGTFIKNIARCTDISSGLSNIITSFTNGEYLFIPITIPQTFKEDNINQHYISTRIRFSRNSLN